MRSCSRFISRRCAASSVFSFVDYKFNSLYLSHVVEDKSSCPFAGANRADLLATIVIKSKINGS